MVGSVTGPAGSGGVPGSSECLDGRDMERLGLEYVGAGLGLSDPVPACGTPSFLPSSYNDSGRE